jgi:hypothetical protein
LEKTDLFTSKKIEYDLSNKTETYTTEVSVSKMDALTNFMSECRLESITEDIDMDNGYNTDEDEFTYETKYESPRVKQIITNAVMYGIIDANYEDYEKDITMFRYFWYKFADLVKEIWNLNDSDMYECFLDMLFQGGPQKYLEKLRLSFPDYEEQIDDIEL